MIGNTRPNTNYDKQLQLQVRNFMRWSLGLGGMGKCALKDFKIGSLLGYEKQDPHGCDQIF